MTWWFWGLLVAVLVALYLSSTAGRLDRLHIRVDQSRAGLDEQLLRRSGVVAELAASGLLDPASSLLLAEAAHQARLAGPPERSRAESDLTEALQLAFDDPESVALLRSDPGGADLVTELAGASRRVQLARRFLDDAADSCARLRRRRVVRVLRLAGSAPWPHSESFVDDSPRALVTA